MNNETNSIRLLVNGIVMKVIKTSGDVEVSIITNNTINIGEILLNEWVNSLRMKRGDITHIVASFDGDMYSRVIVQEIMDLVKLILYTYNEDKKFYFDIDYTMIN
jgi:hypothetical protein